MKYKKGTFVIIPNMERLDLLPSTSQALYIWICKYSNDDGECFPSRSKLAKHVGCDIRTIDKHINFLIELGFMTKEIRHKKGSKENMSNLYQLQLIRHPSEVIDTTPSELNDTITISNINSTNITNTKEVIPVKEEGVTLPKMRLDGSSSGKTSVDRLLYLYSKLYYQTYTATYKPNYGRDKKILTDVLTMYSEVQTAYLLCVYFNWHGMTGSDSKEYNFVTGATFPITMFKTMINKFEVYARNIMSVPFDDDSKLLDEVIKIVSQ